MRSELVPWKNCLFKISVSSVVKIGATSQELVSLFVGFGCVVTFNYGLIPKTFCLLLSLAISFFAIFTILNHAARSFD